MHCDYIRGVFFLPEATMVKRERLFPYFVRGIVPDVVIRWCLRTDEEKSMNRENSGFGVDL